MAENKNTLHGKPWQTESKHTSYQEADQRRNKLLKKKEDKLQAKVRRYADGSFRVLTRVLGEATNKSKKKKRSTKKKNA